MEVVQTVGLAILVGLAVCGMAYAIGYMARLGVEEAQKHFNHNVDVHLVWKESPEDQDGEAKQNVTKQADGSSQASSAAPASPNRSKQGKKTA